MIQPMDRSRRRHGGEEVPVVSTRAIEHMPAALVQAALEANRNLLTAMRLLPKSIHWCRRYPTEMATAVGTSPDSVAQDK